MSPTGCSGAVLRDARERGALELGGLANAAQSIPLIGVGVSACGAASSDMSGPSEANVSGVGATGSNLLVATIGCSGASVAAGVVGGAITGVGTLVGVRGGATTTAGTTTTGGAALAGTGGAMTAAATGGGALAGAGGGAMTAAGATMTGG